jgi:hypothetical protein
MATRSAIFNEATGQLRYIHFDGYPEGVGSTLAIYYGTTDRVSALYARAAASDLSCLAATTAGSEWYDDGELAFPFHYIAPGAYIAVQNSDCEYMYTWDGVRWTVRKIAR